MASLPSTRPGVPWTTFPALPRSQGDFQGEWRKGQEDSGAERRLPTAWWGKDLWVSHGMSRH